MSVTLIAKSAPNRLGLEVRAKTRHTLIGVSIDWNETAPLPHPNMKMDTYDITRTEYFLDRWKESIEIEMENGDGSEDSLKAPAESRRKRTSIP